MRRRYRSKSPKSNEAAFVIVGFIMILLAAMSFWQAKQDKASYDGCTETAQGIVVSVDKQMRSRKHDGRTRHYYVYSIGYVYEADGKEYEGFKTLSENERRAEGYKFNVSYDPNDPAKHYSEFDERDYAGSLAVTVGFGVVGILIIIIGIANGHKRVREGY